MDNKATRVVNIRVEVEDDTSIDKIEEIIGDTLSEEGVNCTYSVEKPLHKSRIHITGDRKEPIISALIDIKITKPEMWKKLSKVVDFTLWDGYSLGIDAVDE